MALLDQLQIAFPDALDYLVSPGNPTAFATYEILPERAAQAEITVGTTLYVAYPILTGQAINYYPLTSLVDGQYYQIVDAPPPTISFVADTQVLALNTWLYHHLAVFNAAKEALLSADVAKAKAVFANPLNGLTVMITAMNADWVSASPETSTSTVVPGSVPEMTLGELSARLEMWTLLEAYLNTPMPRTGLTPMQILSKVR